MKLKVVILVIKNVEVMVVEDKKKSIQLKVVEAMQDDAYKGVARVDAELMRQLDLKRGDAISIKGTRETVAIVDRAYPADVGEGIIRIDGILRRNSRAGIGDVVAVSKIVVQKAKKITIAPAQKGIMVQGDPESLRRSLFGRTLMKGDLFVLGGVQRRKYLLSNDFGDLNDVLGDMLGNMGFGGNLGGGISQIKFIVVNASPNVPVMVDENTQVVLNPKAVEINDEKIPEMNYEDIGGLSDEIKKIREMVEIPIKHPEIFHRLGIDPPKGVLLHGPPGTGKTLLAKAVANESEARFFVINGPEVMSKFYGESEENLRKIFDEAEKNAPSIIFIDELDAIASKREESKGEVERRVVAQLLTIMDGLKSRGKVVVIAATNIPNSLDPALRRPGRFDREIEIGVPGKEGRLNVLKIHTRGMPLLKKENVRELKERIKDLNEKKVVDLDYLAEITYGFVGADLASLCKEAAMVVLRKVISDLNLQNDEPLSEELLEKLIITQDDFTEALKVVRPSALREVLIEKPNVKWEDVGGLDDAKQELQEAIEWPLQNHAAFERLGIKPPAGVLLYGPPGSGKTMLAKAVANESKANFILVNGPELMSKWVGESEKAVRKIFEKARQSSPSIVFFDEIDSLVPKRGSFSDSSGVTEKVVNQLLTYFFFQAEDGIRDWSVTGVQTCALPI